MEQGKTKVITVRLSPEDAHRAEIVARVDELSVNEVFRRALVEYFERRRADADFVERARAMVARDAEIVGGLR
jgi:predicted transcriptional regulator